MTMPFTLGGMKTKALGWLVLMAVIWMAAGTGCSSSNEGAREFIPGKGWQPVD